MKYITIFLFVTTLAFAQKQLTVLDSVTKSPVAYAAINLNNNYGIYSDANGIAIITDTIVNNVTISSIGYADKTVTLQRKMQVVYLASKPIQLNEVIVTQAKKIKRREQVVKPKIHQDTHAFEMSRATAQYAFLVPAAKTDTYLTAIALPLFKIAFEAEGYPGVFEKIVFRTLVRVEILTNNNGLPGEKLNDYEQYAVITNSVNDKQFDLKLDQELPLPTNGLFVQFTMLGKADENGNLSKELPYTNIDRNDGTTIKFFKWMQPNFPLVEQPKGTLTFVKFPFMDNNSWQTINEPALHEYKKYPDFNIGIGYTVVSYQ